VIPISQQAGNNETSPGQGVIGVSGGRVLEEGRNGKLCTLYLRNYARAP